LQELNVERLQKTLKRLKMTLHLYFFKIRISHFKRQDDIEMLTMIVSSYPQFP